MALTQSCGLSNLLASVVYLLASGDTASSFLLGVLVVDLLVFLSVPHSSGAFALLFAHPFLGCKDSVDTVDSAAELTYGEAGVHNAC